MNERVPWDARLRMYGYDALEPEAFTKLSSIDAERLVRELVEAERLDRFRDPRPELTGPPPPSGSGADLLFTPRSAPVCEREKFVEKFGTEALTYDGVGRPVAFSVKSGELWRESALSDARSETEAEWAVDALAAGGHFVLVTTRSKATAQPKAARATGAAPMKATKAKPLKEPPPLGHELQNLLAVALHERLRKRISGAENPTDRVHVLDRQDLTTYLQKTGFVLSEGMREKLGVPRPGALLTLEGWKVDHRGDRPGSDVAFVADANRDDASRRIQEVLDATGTGAEARIAWLVAPPGVGKTRVVLETLERDPAFARRTLAATSGKEGLTAIEDGLFDRYKNAILVIDDCEPGDIGRILRLFRHAPTSARMVVVTPRAHAVALDELLEPILLNPMERAQVTLLLSSVLKDLDEAADVAELSEGYPRFALLVAMAVRGGAAMPARNDLWRAVELALDPARREVTERSAALFALSLLGTDFRKQAVAEEAALARWLQFATFAELERALESCYRRGLVRRRRLETERYVTPAILEREIIKRYLAPPPGSPPFDRTRFPQSMAAALDALRARAVELAWLPKDLVALAQPTLRGLEQCVIGSEFAFVLSTSEMRYAAEHAPQETARRSRALVERTSLDTLREDRVTRPALRLGLREAMAHRGTFEDVEAALFRLACAENQPNAENNTTNLWAELFEIVVHPTYESLAVRLGALERRVHETSVEARRAVLVALGVLTTDRGTRLVRAETDGPRPTTTVAAGTEALQRVWRWLIECAAPARDDDTAFRAAEIIANHLSVAARQGLLPPLEDSLVALAPTFPARVLQKLFESLDRASRRPSTDDATRGTLRRLLEAFEPSSFEARLRLAVSVPRPMKPWEVVLEPLAQEALAEPSEFEAQLLWLISAETVGANFFVQMLGERDEGHRLHELLRAQLPSSRSLFSSYLAGRHRAKDPSVDAVLARLRAEGQYDLVAETGWRIGFDSQRAHWFAEDTPQLSNWVFERLWFANFETPYAASVVVKALLDPAIPERIVAPASLAALAVSESEFAAAPNHWMPALREAFSRVSKLDLPDWRYGESWNRAARKLLIDGGLVDEVARGAAHALLRNGDSSSIDAEEILVECARVDGEASWLAVRDVLEGGDPEELEFFGDAGIANHLPVDAVVEWVGGNEKRAVLMCRFLTYETEPPPALARALVAKFGAESRVGHLVEQGLSRPEGNARRSSFTHAERANHLRPWTRDRSQAVRTVAAKAIASLAYIDATDQEGAARRAAQERRRSG